MWHPKQLLFDEVVQTLREAGFGEMTIEFLGWMSGRAKALNNSKNPAAAAHTILASEKTPKSLEDFERKKKESVAPKEAPEHEEVTRRLRKLEEWQTEVEEEAKPRKRKGAAAGDDD